MKTVASTTRYYKRRLKFLGARQKRVAQDAATLNENLGRFARTLRADARLKLVTVARRMGISTTRVFKLEQGSGAIWTNHLLRQYVKAIRAGGPKRPYRYHTK